MANRRNKLNPLGEIVKKRIGIIGGISAASTAQYYKTITGMYFEQNHDYYYPEIIIYSLDFQYFTDLENERKTGEYIEYILGAARSLEKAGADFIAMAANSPHSVFEEVSGKAGVPMLSIVEATAKAASARGIKKALLTGIKYTMQSDFYQKGFQKRGIEILVPDESHQNQINDIIFNELVINHISGETRKKFLDIVNSYTVDGIILGCTELPLLISQEHTKLKVLDTLELHCAAILKEAITR